MNLRSYSLVALAALGGPLWAQTEINLTRQARIESGGQLPAGCSPGQLFVKTDASGPALYTCSARDAWSPAISYLAGPGIAIGGNSIAMDDAVTPVYYAGAGAPILDCAAGRDYYVDTSGGALYYCKAAGQWQALSAAGHTHAAGEITSGTLSGSVLPQDAVLTGRPNAYAAGARQSMTHTALSAGLRLAPAAGDPANAEDGDVWYNITTGKFRRRQNGANGDWDAGGSGGASTHDLLSATHTDTTSGAPARGDLITAQGDSPAWSRLPIGGAGAFLRSDGTDVSYGSISAGDLPSGYSWTGLANVPAVFPPAGHAASHQNSGTDEIATATPAANAIPKAGAGGALAAGWLPAPGASTLGGVKSFTAGAHQWMNAISTTGTPSAAQPACGDLSNGAASCSVDATNASNITSGMLPPGRLPSPGASTLGGVQSKDCSGAGHVLKINTDGSVTCSPDSGGGGGGGGVTMSAGVGKICLLDPCLGVTGGTSSIYTSNRVYYFQSNIYATIPVKQILMYLKPGTSSATHYAMAFMDASCAKVSGSDINYTVNGDQYTTATYASPVTLPPGVYYLAIVTDAPAGGVIGWVNIVPALSNGIYAGAAPRFFYGGNPPTGSGASLAVPSSCGAATAANESFAPIAWLVP